MKLVLFSLAMLYSQFYYHSQRVLSTFCFTFILMLILFETNNLTKTLCNSYKRTKKTIQISVCTIIKNLKNLKTEYYNIF